MFSKYRVLVTSTKGSKGSKTKMPDESQAQTLAERHRKLACSADPQETDHSTQVVATQAEAAGYRLA